jgi:hypothetical protein
VPFGGLRSVSSIAYSLNYLIMALPIQSLDIDSGEFGPPDGAAESEPEPTAVNTLVNALVEKALAPDVTAEDTDENYMNEADKRLEIATYYRELTRAALFSNTSEASQLVEKEIRDFVRGRLEVLLGIKPENKPTMVFKSPFSEGEVATLKTLAGMNAVELSTLRMLLDKVLTMNSPKVETKQDPTIRVAATPAPRQAPSITPRQSPVAPSAQPATAPPAAATPAPEPVRRGVGRPRKEPVMVEDPITHEMKELKVRPGQVANPRALPMPTGAGLHAATMVAASRSVASMESTPAAKMILGT